MIALRFLLKKKFEGCISSGNIGIRTPTKVSLKLGFLKLVCKGVNDVIGESISVEGACLVLFRIPTGVVGVE
jgi:hypothetical protein